jgi:hypothetical protein
MPTSAATRVAQPRSPLARQSAARSTRPPSSGKRGNQVEDEQGEVDVAEPGGNAVDGARQPCERKQGEATAENDRDEWACNRYSKFRARARERTFELGHAAEEPERDPVDLQPVASGLPRMSELVKKHRGKEHESGGDGHGEMNTVGELRVL